MNLRNTYKSHNSLHILLFITFCLFWGCVSKNKPTRQYSTSDISNIKINSFIDKSHTADYNYSYCDKITMTRVVAEPEVVYYVKNNNDLKALYETNPNVEHIYFFGFGSKSNTNYNIDPIIKKFLHLKSIDLFTNTNNLKGLKHFESIKKLERLNIKLRYNKDIDLDFSQLSNLNHLSLSLDSIQKFPISIFDTKNIKTLTLMEFNNLMHTDTLYGIEKLTQLESLYINSERLCLPSSTRKIFPKLWSLIFSNKDTTKLPNTIDYSILKTFDCNSKIAIYPKDTSFDSLQYLSLRSTIGMSDIKINPNIKCLRLSPKYEQDCEINLSVFNDLTNLKISDMHKFSSFPTLRNTSISSLVVDQMPVADSVLNNLDSLNYYLQSKLSKKN